MADFHCPVCGKPLARRARRDGSGYFWSCTGYPDCNYIADDWKEEPYIHNCPECGEPLRVRTSQKTGKPYIACFKKENHKSGEAIFFNDDGTPKTGETEHPQAKGKFTCPKCGSALKYFKLKSGPNAGTMSWGCFNQDGHESGRPEFFNDDDGRPVF